MEMWGPGSFDYDDAGKWFCELLANEDGWEFVNDCLKTIIRLKELDVYLHIPFCQDAIVAAECVAAAIGHPAGDIPQTGRSWIKENAATLPNELQDLALKAIALIRTESDLKEHWDKELESSHAWSKQIADLEKRLSTP